MGVKRCCMAFLVCLAMMAGHGRAAQADSYRNIENSSPQEVVDGMMNKAGRGMANMTTGWMELPKQIYETSRDEGAAKGASGREGSQTAPSWWSGSDTLDRVPVSLLLCDFAVARYAAG